MAYHLQTKPSKVSGEVIRFLKATCNTRPPCGWQIIFRCVGPDSAAARGWKGTPPTRSRGTCLLHRGAHRFGDDCARFQPRKLKKPQLIERVTAYIPSGVPVDAVRNMSGKHQRDLVLAATHQPVSVRVARDLVQSWAGVEDLSDDYCILESYLEVIRTKIPGSVAEVTWETVTHDDGSITKHFKRLFLLLGKTREYLTHRNTRVVL